MRFISLPYMFLSHHAKMHNYPLVFEDASLDALKTQLTLKYSGDTYPEYCVG